MEFMPALLQPEETNRMIARIERHFEQHGFGLFAAELRRDRTFLGFIGLSVAAFEAPFMPAVEIGWRLDAEYWGQGLATEGAREVLRYGFQEVGLSKIVSFTVPENTRSRRVMEKLGMIHDQAADFDHPLLLPGHPRRRHVLYRLNREDWEPAE
jgi:RimJ/RimL family protein N-acetyltransferase